MANTNRATTSETSAPAPETTAATEHADVSTKKGAGICCYIGPNVTGVIQKGTLYAVPKEEAVKDPIVAAAIKKHPRVEALIISGEQLGAALIEVKKPGTALYKEYRAMVRGR